VSWKGFLAWATSSRLDQSWATARQPTCSLISAGNFRFGKTKPLDHHQHPHFARRIDAGALGVSIRAAAGRLPPVPEDLRSGPESQSLGGAPRAITAAIRGMRLRRAAPADLTMLPGSENAEPKSRLGRSA